MRIVLMGDICLFDMKEHALSIAAISDRKPDLCVANLETPLEGVKRTRAKAGPALKGEVETLDLFSAHFDHLCFNLANNHIMDYGESGLRQTINECHRLNIPVVGAGFNLGEANSAVILDIGDTRLGILGCCETQFGIASNSRAGVSPANVTINRLIRELRSEVDVVLVSIHGASEMSPWPSPHWQDFLRSFVDAGAHIVHGHHAHVPQGYESYGEGYIFYGLGNFLVDPANWQEQPNTMWSVVAECEVVDDSVNCSVKPVVIAADNGQLEVAPVIDSESQQYVEYLAKCNEPLSDRTFLTGLWQEVAVRAYEHWYRDWLEFSPSRTPRRIGLTDRFTTLARCVRRGLRGPRSATRSEMLLWYHLFACQSHQEAIMTALGVLSEELEDLRIASTARLVDEMMPGLH